MKTIIMIIIPVLTFSCATQRQTTKEKPEFKEIRFGSKGGFTGMGKQYLIKNDGKVYIVHNDSLTLLNQVDSKVIDNINNQLVEMAFEYINFDEKGNITYCIEVVTPKYKNIVSWTDLSEAENLKEFYKTLVKTLKKQ